MSDDTEKLRKLTLEMLMESVEMEECPKVNEVIEKNGTEAIVDYILKEISEEGKKAILAQETCTYFRRGSITVFGSCEEPLVRCHISEIADVPPPLTLEDKVAQWQEELEKLKALSPKGSPQSLFVLQKTFGPKTGFTGKWPMYGYPSSYTLSIRGTYCFKPAPADSYEVRELNPCGTFDPENSQVYLIERNREVVGVAFDEKSAQLEAKLAKSYMTSNGMDRETKEYLEEIVHIRKAEIVDFKEFLNIYKQGKTLETVVEVAEGMESEVELS